MASGIATICLRAVSNHYRNAKTRIFEDSFMMQKLKLAPFGAGVAAVLCAIQDAIGDFDLNRAPMMTDFVAAAPT